MAHKKQLIHESEDGFLFFDPDTMWFHYMTKNENCTDKISPIGIYRRGNFHLTESEFTAIQDWLLRNLKDGVFQD